MEGTSGGWLPPHPFAAAVARITALVPGATMLLRLCLCVLILHLQNIPSLQFSNLDRSGCLQEEGFFSHGSWGILGPWGGVGIGPKCSSENMEERECRPGENARPSTPPASPVPALPGGVR